MGKVEKIVVLGVLFVIVSILAVSLDRGLGDELPAVGGAGVGWRGRVHEGNARREA